MSYTRQYLHDSVAFNLNLIRFVEWHYKVPGSDIQYINLAFQKILFCYEHGFLKYTETAKANPVSSIVPRVNAVYILEEKLGYFCVEQLTKWNVVVDDDCVPTNLGRYSKRDNLFVLQKLVPNINQVYVRTVERGWQQTFRVVEARRKGISFWKKVNEKRF